LSLESCIFCTIVPIIYSPAAPDNYKRNLEKLEQQRARGAKVFGQSMSRSFNINIRLSETLFLLYGVPSWYALMQRPIDERVASFGDPARLEKLVSDAGRIVPLMSAAVVGEIYNPSNQRIRVGG
jgi:hypothetical protein